ncbi:probable proton-coupled zinc antiporter SLC30A3 isoform X1 [Dendropsophus ebraccatus]|uniref:probable proton-coupled zinc antiporter SLC30A3 isoform X1 n=1 Tax=Dendropsophus ebraccatus TaxID=150705 RepID=UPI003831C4D3
MEPGGDSETRRLVEPNKGGGGLKIKSLFTGTKDLFPGFPFQNGGSAVSIELERPISQHCHGPCSFSDNQQKLQARKKLYFACVVCFLFMIGEVAGGYIAHSLAIMTDAAHLLTDLGSMCVSLFSLWISSRPPTKNMTFGWHRSEILGALASVLSIWIVTGILLYLATARIINNDYDIDGHVMLITSGCAVIVNIIMAYILHQSTNFHGHSHGSGYEKIGDSQSSGLSLHLGHHGNTSVRAAFIHVIGDLLQSIGVMVAAIIIYFKMRLVRPTLFSKRPQNFFRPNLSSLLAQSKWRDMWMIWRCAHSAKTQLDDQNAFSNVPSIRKSGTKPWNMLVIGHSHMGFRPLLMNSCFLQKPYTRQLSMYQEGRASIEYIEIRPNRELAQISNIPSYAF